MQRKPVLADNFVSGYTPQITQLLSKLCNMTNNCVISLGKDISSIYFILTMPLVVMPIVLTKKNPLF